MTIRDDITNELKGKPARWLVTGAAGFIGSHLVETLLRLDQHVTGLDNFSTGKRTNLEEVRSLVGEVCWKRFRLVEADVQSPDACAQACAGIDYVLHQAALGSVPRSIASPSDTNSANVSGTVNMLLAAKNAGVKRFVFASSSSVYGDHPALPKREAEIGNCLSPYAVSKRVCELYADVFHRTYGLQCVGLRYFNVFGPRQDPEGAYAAVIPRWIAALLDRNEIFINGDGETSRDFCYVDNVVQANILAAKAPYKTDEPQIYNIAVSGRTTLNQLYRLIRDRAAQHEPAALGANPVYREFRAGDVRHSNADIAKASKLLGYKPTHEVEEGLAVTVDWYAMRRKPALVSVETRQAPAGRK